MSETIKMLKASCLILAGGRGTRLTPDKPLLKIDGTPIIERVARIVVPLFEEAIVVTNSPEKYAFLSLPLVADERPGCGPLMGIYSGLKHIRNEAAFVCAADMPFLNEAVIRAELSTIGDHDIVVPWPRKRPQFLHAVYRKRCLPVLRENLAADRYKIETLMQQCRTLRLDSGWFERRGLTEAADLAFSNINTIQDYRRWAGEEAAGADFPANGVLGKIAADVVEEIRRTLIEQESAYQQQSTEEPVSSIWAHSSRVGRIAHHIAESEGWEAESALLAGLLHDIGKFAHGTYHENDTPEEEKAVRFVEKILSGTAYERWIPVIEEAILTTYLEGEATSDVGRAVYDADCLDKLGTMGVVQFFAKKALRRQFLSDDVLIRTSIELTYARHAPDTLKTATGRALALERSARTRRFYAELLEEWRQLGLGAFSIVEEEIAGIDCILVVPASCGCGGRPRIESDIKDAVKCRSVVVTYRCPSCGEKREFSFCLPNVKGLPWKGDREWESPHGTGPRW